MQYYHYYYPTTTTTTITKSAYKIFIELELCFEVATHDFKIIFYN